MMGKDARCWRRTTAPYFSTPESHPEGWEEIALSGITIVTSPSMILCQNFVATQVNEVDCTSGEESDDDAPIIVDAEGRK